MKNKLSAFLLSLLAFAATAQETKQSFDFQSIPINQVISLYFKEVSKKPHVICNEVLQDSRLVSIRASGKQLDSAVFKSLIDSHGYSIEDRSGISFVCVQKKSPSANDAEPFVYQPQYRDIPYLVDLLQPLFTGVFVNKRAPAQALSVGVSTPAESSSSVASSYKPSTQDDLLIFLGSQSEREKLARFLPQLDTPPGEVVVKALVYEVGKSSADASSLDLLASILRGRVEIALAGPVLANSLRIKAGGLDAVASILSSDGRFKVITSPYTRVRSGSSARFQVGSDVPVLGAIFTTAAGSSSQSVEYRSSGTLLEVTPRVRGASIDLDLLQQISSFITTENGVNASPTLNKREIRTSLTVADDELLVIGGLNDSKQESSTSALPFFPLPIGKSSTNRSTDLLLFLQVKRLRSS